MKTDLRPCEHQTAQTSGAKSQALIRSRVSGVRQLQTFITLHQYTFSHWVLHWINLQYPISPGTSRLHKDKRGRWWQEWPQSHREKWLIIRGGADNQRQDFTAQKRTPNHGGFFFETAAVTLGASGDSPSCNYSLSRLFATYFESPSRKKWKIF